MKSQATACQLNIYNQVQPGLYLRVCAKKYFSTKTYVGSTQKTVSMRRFLAPKTYDKTDVLKNIYNFTLRNCLSKPVYDGRVIFSCCGSYKQTAKCRQTVQP